MAKTKTKDRNKNKKKINTTAAVPLIHSVEMRFAYQVAGLRGKELLDKFKNYSKATVYNHAKKQVCGNIPVDRRHMNKGRPSKVTKRDVRNTTRQIPILRESVGSFTSKKIQMEAGLDHISNRTFRRILNREGYHYCRSRKKGLLKPHDVKNRLKYCRQIKKDNITQDYWNFGISFYFDGVGFVYKTNPMDEALAPTAREWRRNNEGLSLGCTAKGRKEGETQAKFMVGISYNRGVVICEQYHGSISGDMFARIVDNCFPQAFNLSINPFDRRFLQDGDPSQNSAAAMEILENIGATSVSIPPRSPDLNVIENFFHLVKKAIKQDTIEKHITFESFEEFSARVKNIIVNYPNRKIDKIIESMDKRINMVIEAKGNRIKY